jgi:hypothetical protein
MLLDKNEDMNDANVYAQTKFLRGILFWAYTFASFIDPALSAGLKKGLVLR